MENAQPSASAPNLCPVFRLGSFQAIGSARFCTGIVMPLAPVALFPVLKHRHSACGPWCRLPEWQFRKRRAEIPVLLLLSRMSSPLLWRGSSTRLAQPVFTIRQRGEEASCKRDLGWIVKSESGCGEAASTRRAHCITKRGQRTSLTPDAGR